MGIKKKIVKTNSKKSGFDFILSYFKEQHKKIRSDKKKQFVFFVLGFVLSYLVLTVAVGIIPDIYYKQAVGGAVQGVLGAQGLNTVSIGSVECMEFSWLSDTAKGTCYSFSVNEKNIVISWLCTGILEIIILICAILASFGVNWKEKAVGIIVAIILGIVFNILRIWVTINLLFSENVATVEIAHDALFRIILFVYIAVVYIIWFYWAANKNGQ
jgi:exosortase/archaeosortase family protein